MAGMPSSEQLDTLERLASEHSVDPLHVEIQMGTATLPDDWMQVKIRGAYFIVAPDGRM